MAGLAFWHEPEAVDTWSGRPETLMAWNYCMKLCPDLNRFAIINPHHLPLANPNEEFECVEYEDPLHFLDGTVGESRAVIGCPWEAGEGAVSLWDFDHNVDWYVFGPASGWKQNEATVFVPQHGHGAMHAIHVAPLVCFHRFHVKHGSTN